MSALDRLFDADRETLLTRLVVAAGERFDLNFDELHNDSTSVKFTGQYVRAKGRSVRGKKAPFITWGFSKDHRFDLKQLLLILTITEDGVPVQFRCEAGNQGDPGTHVETWETLRRVTGRNDFLYVSDCKLASRGAMEHIANHRGRFVTVMPRSRREDELFREWIQDHEPAWNLVIDQSNPRKKWGPRDRWYVFRSHRPSSEGWPIVWAYSSLLRTKQENSRLERIARAEQELDGLAKYFLGPRPRKKDLHEIRTKIDKILQAAVVERYIQVLVDPFYENQFKQDRPGRAGPDTKFVRKTKMRWRITWSIDHDKIEWDHKSDGMYPLLTNDKKLSDIQVLEAHKRQARIERRFEALKTVHEIGPALMKNEDRVEALFFMYFIALFVEALIEREIRQAMAKEGITQIPLYPEGRKDPKPTGLQIYRLFSTVQRALLIDTDTGVVVKVYEPQLTEIQEEVLRLLSVPRSAYGLIS